jgi:hypothetical protein
LCWNAKTLVVFAKLEGRGFRVPANSNGVERVMGMVAGRHKRKWAHWGLN